MVGLVYDFAGLAADVLAAATFACANAFSRSTSLSFLAASRSAITSCKLLSLSTNAQSGCEGGIRLH